MVISSLDSSLGRKSVQTMNVGGRWSASISILCVVAILRPAVWAQVCVLTQRGRSKKGQRTADEIITASGATSHQVSGARREQHFSWPPLVHF